MQLNKIYLRYYPPGIGLSFLNDSGEHIKMIDCLDLTINTNIEQVAKCLCLSENLLNKGYQPELRTSLRKLQEKLRVPVKNKFYHYKTLKANILPITNVAFNKEGSSFVTGSYDRTARIWDVESGMNLCVLQGHQNAVFAVQYNYPVCDKVVTASFDKTSKLWSTLNGSCLRTYYGHTAEVVMSEFSQSTNSLVSARGKDLLMNIYIHAIFKYSLDIH